MTFLPLRLIGGRSSAGAGYGTRPACYEMGTGVCRFGPRDRPRPGERHAHTCEKSRQAAEHFFEGCARCARVPVSPGVPARPHARPQRKGGGRYCEDVAACAASQRCSTRPGPRPPTPVSGWPTRCATAAPTARAVQSFGPATLVSTRLAIIDVAGGDQPLFSEDGQHRAGGQRRDLQPPGPAAGPGGPRPPLRDRLGLRGARAPLRAGRARTSCGHVNGMYGFALWDGREKRLRRRARPVRRQAPVLVERRPPHGGRLRGRRADRRRAGGAASSTRWRSTTTWRAASCPGRGPSSRGSASWRPASCSIADARRPEPKIESFREAPGPEIDRRTTSPASWPTSFTAAVERQMMSDVPYGALLSGGVDSAAIVAAMEQRASSSRRRPSPSASPARATCSTSARRPPRARESWVPTTTTRRWSRATSSTELGGAVRRLEEPCGIPSAPALLQLSRFAAQDVKVVLSGQGADEPHGGYGRHQAAALLGPLSPPAGAAGRLGREAAQRACAAPGPPARPDGGRPAAGAAGGDQRQGPAEAADGEPGRGGGGGADDAGSRPAGRRSRPRPARPGPLPRHAHVPAGEPADLRRQDVDGGQPRAARPLPRRRAHALRGAHSRARSRAPARRQATAPRGDGASAASGDRPAAQARVLEPVGGLAEGVAGSRDREALRARHGDCPSWSIPRPRSNWSGPTARAAPTTAGSCSACSSCPSGTRRS